MYGNYITWDENAPHQKHKVIRLSVSQASKTSFWMIGQISSSDFRNNEDHHLVVSQSVVEY